jgi:hypothetical protein
MWGNEDDGDLEDDVDTRSIEAVLPDVIKTLKNTGLH